MTVATWVLGAFLLLVGVTHQVVPDYFLSLIPDRLPAKRVLVHASGLVEIALGAGLLIEFTRVGAAWGAVGLMAVYVLTHVDALRRATSAAPRWLERPPGAVARVVVNLAYLGWAVLVALAAPGGQL